MTDARDPREWSPDGRRRARGLGIPFRGEPGPWNAITDVPGVEVGYRTLIEGDSVRTGVTAIHPRGRGNATDPVIAGVHSHNGNGEMTGTAWINESGTFSGPIAVTNTHAVGVAHAGIVAWTVEHHPAAANAWLLPVAAETWDGYLNDINGRHVTEDTVVEALEAARSGPIEEGSVGGGTGMNCYQYKGGSGTASRLVGYGDDSYTVGAFVQANFGARNELTIAGIPLGRELAGDNPMAQWSPVPPGAGSIITVIATDAPLLPGQCAALARRVTLGMGRTGASSSHFSGDLFLALSVGNPGAVTPGLAAFHGASPGHYDHLRFVPWGHMNPFYDAVVQATEEAILNALVVNDDMTGIDGHRAPALPHETVRTAMHRHWGAAC